MYYFASDLHLGLDAAMSSAQRERLFVQWLDMAAMDAKAIFLVGDIFDFWFEFRTVVPKGFTRLLGKLGELTDRGIAIHLFTGNHDMWMWGYLQKECGVVLHTGAEIFELYGKMVFIAHGDNLYPRKRPWERIVQGCFHSRPLRWICRRLLHPGLVMSLGIGWSRKHRESNMKTHVFCGDDEPLVRYAKRRLASTINSDNKAAASIDYFVFGHLHCANIHDMGDGCRLLLLGDWLYQTTYGVITPDGEIHIRSFADYQHDKI